MKSQKRTKSFIKSETLFRHGIRLFIALVLVLATVAALDWVYQEDKFLVRNVRMEGKFERVQREQLARTVMDSVRGNIFALDLDVIRQKAESLPWVYRAEVRRGWPHDIHIRFVEQNLLGRWNQGAWVNSAAKVVKIQGAERYDNALPKLAGPVGTAAKVVQQLHYFRQVLRPIDLRIAELRLTSRGSWKILVDSGFLIILSKKGYRGEIQRFGQVYAKTLKYQKQELTYIDMRYTNGFAVRWRNTPRLVSRLRNEG